MSRRSDLPGDFLDLVDAYCSGLIEDGDLARLEARLLDGAAERRYFVEYFHHHTEIQFATRAAQAADSVFDQLAVARPSPADPAPRRWQAWLLSGRARWLALAGSILIAAATLSLFGLGMAAGPNRWAWLPGARPAIANVAWLVNAQNCRWAGPLGEPGRDMRAGKHLRLDRGLAEIEFDKGARVILQGPAGLELVSGSAARLVYGTLTARVPEQARGFTVLSPRGKVVDLGTEFGLSVDSQGATTLHVFTGEVAAIPLVSNQRTTVFQDQTARIEGRTVVKSHEKPSDQSRYVRAIEAPPVLLPHSLSLDFTKPLAGGLRDRSGQSVGLTHRLPGTGVALPARDPNLRVVRKRGALELTTTRSDLNTQEHMPIGEYLGWHLPELGFTGKEDFQISATIPNIPGLALVGQFGLYVGPNSQKNIRGGLISRPMPDLYRLFLVNNCKGIDTDIYEVGLMTTGDDLRLTLRRIAGRYSLVVENLTRKSSSTLTIVHPAFLDDEKDLYVGLFGANTQSELRKTLTIRELSVTVWTAQPDDRATTRAAPRR
jgi:hypothetical protein